jgi:hypothetical protein
VSNVADHNMQAPDQHTEACTHTLVVPVQDGNDPKTLSSDIGNAQTMRELNHGVGSECSCHIRQEENPRFSSTSDSDLDSSRRSTSTVKTKTGFERDLSRSRGSRHVRLSLATDPVDDESQVELSLAAVSVDKKATKKGRRKKRARGVDMSDTLPRKSILE